MTVITASAQRFIDDAIVAEKRDGKDYDVMVSPVFEYAGIQMRVVLDGHHSLAAARIDGIEPCFAEADASDSDTIRLIERGEIEDFLELSRIDSDYYDINTGRDIW